MDVAINEPLGLTEQVTAWKNVALNRFENQGIYSEMRNYYDGYASACEDVLKLLKSESVQGVVEEVKKGHKLRNALLLTFAVGGAYICVERYENGILFPWQKKDD